MDKDLEEAVEKKIKEHEERRLKETAPPEKKKNKMKHIDAAILLIVIIGLIAWATWPSLVTEDKPTIVHPANVVLDSFEDRFVTHDGDGYVSITFQLESTGDEVATDVSCFIKCCNQKGTILFAQLFTFDDLSPSNMASGECDVPITNETMWITHSIEVHWSPQGTNTYMRLTEV